MGMSGIAGRDQAKGAARFDVSDDDALRNSMNNFSTHNSSLPHYSITGAKAQWRHFMKRVARGESMIITRGGVPVARLDPYIAVPVDRSLAALHELAAQAQELNLGY